ncbi:MAG: hypothetical protein K2X64_04980, partial [Rhodocyclaceae bacterium]|nr:hypothetical protein [Rhodocyclaceae bacterium]
MAALMAPSWLDARAQIAEPTSAKPPVKLEALTPTLDTSAPETDKTLSGRVEDVFNPEVLVIPKSGSTRVYEVGMELYKEGDYRRAMNAFKLAMIRAGKFSPNDPRTEACRKAIEATKAQMSLRSELGYDVDNKNKNVLTGKVTKVFLPSLAWLSGLRKDDDILKAKIENEYVYLTVKRRSKNYNLKLKYREPSSPLKGMNGKFDSTPANRFEGKITHPEILDQSVKYLANYDCALLIDCSASMESKLAASNHGLLESRWQWCKNECLSFYKQGEGYFPNGITMVPFNHEFAISKNAHFSEIANIYNTLNPTGGTDIAQPLSYLIEDYFQRKSQGNVKPLAIAVLSDGEASSVAIRDVLVNATQRMKHPKELLITFLTVDVSSFGTPVIRAM